MTLVDMVKGVRELIARTGWVSGTLAITREGMECSPHSPLATAFCISGAAQCVARDPQLRKKFYDLLSEVIDGLAPIYWNDVVVTSKQEVIDALDRALSRAEQPVTLQLVNARRT